MQKYRLVFQDTVSKEKFYGKWTENEKRIDHEVREGNVEYDGRFTHWKEYLL